MRLDFAENGRAQRLHVYCCFIEKKLKKEWENIYKQKHENPEI